MSTATTTRPMCYGCGDKPARKLRQLPGAYGEVAFFCSLRCAAKDGVERPLALDMVWCPIHKVWSEGTCWECQDQENVA